MAGQNGNVYGKKTGSSLGKCDDVDEVLVIQPLPLYKFGLYGHYHRDSATYGKRPDFCENLENLPVRNHIGEQKYKIF